MTPQNFLSIDVGPLFFTVPLVTRIVLARAYTAGNGVPQDNQRALVWALRAARSGHPDGQHYAGQFYCNGQGVGIDRVEGHKWLNLAAGDCHNGAASARDKCKAGMTRS